MRARQQALLPMLAASLLFADMGVCVKLASELYPAGEIVFYRRLVGMLFAYALSRSRGSSLRTDVPAMHFWRSLCGVLSLGLYFYAIGGLPLATAATLNYLSSVWMALFLLGGAVLLGSAQVDGRLDAVECRAAIHRHTLRRALWRVAVWRAQHLSWMDFVGMLLIVLAGLTSTLLSQLPGTAHPNSEC